MRGNVYLAKTHFVRALWTLGGGVSSLGIALGVEQLFGDGYVVNIFGLIGAVGCLAGVVFLFTAFANLIGRTNDGGYYVSLQCPQCGNELSAWSLDSAKSKPCPNCGAMVRMPE